MLNVLHYPTSRYSQTVVKILDVTLILYRVDQNNMNSVFLHL